MRTPGGILAVLYSVAPAAAKPGVDQQIAQLESSNSKLLQYPTQFTQSIMPKAIHSHNDYWRDVPLLTALSFGVASVEADVSLINGTLYVGHENQALTPDRTLDSLYIQPLLQILHNQNPQTEFTAGSTSHNGVFDVDGGQTLQLVIEIKTDGVATLPSVLAALEPLRSAGYLTTFANGTLTRSAVTVVGTGNSPLEQIKELSPRDFFFDAPLSQLTDPSLNTTWDATLAPLASTDYEAVVGWNGFGTISDEQKGNITKFVGDAHERGIAARFWNTPAWPVSARENIWRALLENGVDWLNADDLAAASSF
ncbi:Altered inheritance of mitochondria protein 6 -like protein [Trametes pubescens]|uniref:Altered inheritance of mitochondria protein 6-like protein n=1 Tax=Trametes pubescens TaxID=154538 RepID=A0A1M2V619_TRAPU|nr:Altered inheritance of mitochondria protein 6 -like protein [Trametes pubescens]